MYMTHIHIVFVYYELNLYDCYCIVCLFKIYLSVYMTAIWFLRIINLGVIWLLNIHLFSSIRQFVWMADNIIDLSNMSSNIYGFELTNLTYRCSIVWSNERIVTEILFLCLGHIISVVEWFGHWIIWYKCVYQ